MKNLENGIGIKQFANVPAPSEELKKWVGESTPIRELEEVVIVKMAPSYFVRDFVKYYLQTVDNFFVGPFASSRPQLHADVFKCVKRGEKLTNEEIMALLAEGKDLQAIQEIEAAQVGEEILTEEQLLCRYFETEFWAIIAHFKRKYCREPELKDLLNHISKQEICTPIFMVNALNCIGPVKVTEKAISLEPEFVDSYNYRNRLLTKEQMIAVSDWFKQLMVHGFSCVERIKIGANGHRDFMMMTLEHSQTPSAEELNGQSETKTEFKVRGPKIAANIVALYRHLFYTDKVKYLSDDRRIFVFGTSESNLLVMRELVKTMLHIGELEQFTVSKSKGSTPVEKKQESTPEQDKDTDTVD